MLSAHEHFVGTKALCISLKFLAQSCNYKVPRNIVLPQSEYILQQIALPLFVCSEKDLKSFVEDPIEFIHLQNDKSGEKNIKL